MTKYDQAIAVYKEGLKVCPEEETLKLGLATAKRAKVESNAAAKSARKTSTAAKASKSRARKAKEAPTVSAFVKETRQQITLQMAALQAQLDLINDLAAMTDEDKSALLFNLIDRDGDGTVDAGELATALRKRNTELSFGESLERAIGMVAAFDADGDAKLDTEEFTTFINAMLQELGLQFTELAEFLVLQLMFSEGEEVPQVDKDFIAQKVIEQEELMDILTDPRLIDLFKLFDNDGSGLLPFREVALGLYQLTRGMDESAITTMEVLLMMDRDENRTLNYERFARLILAFVASADTTFDDIADDLVLELTRIAVPVSKDDWKRLLVKDECYQAALDISRDLPNEELSQAMTPLSYGRLQRLFDLWDVDGNADISFAELSDGLRIFQSAAGISDDVGKHTQFFIGFDKDGDQALGRTEFAHAMVHYADSFKVDLGELIDFMCVTTVLGEEKTKGYQNAFRQSLLGKGTQTVRPVHLQYYEAPTDGENGE